MLPFKRYIIWHCPARSIHSLCVVVKKRLLIFDSLFSHFPLLTRVRSCRELLDYIYLDLKFDVIYVEIYIVCSIIGLVYAEIEKYILSAARKGTCGNGKLTRL